MIITFPNLPNYRISVDDWNHTLEKVVIVPEINVKTGKPNKFPGPKWSAVGYYPNVGQAIHGILRHSTFNSDLEVEMQEYIDWVEGLLDKCMKIEEESK